MKKLLCIIMLLLCIMAFMSCVSDVEAPNMAKIIADKRMEIDAANLHYAGESIVLSEEKEIVRLLDTLSNIEFMSSSEDILTPGAAALIIELADLAITLPYWQYEGNNYAADSGSVQLFAEYFERK